MKCVDCTTTLTRHNPDIRCFMHQRSNAHLQEYVERYEIEAMGLEKWARAQTERKTFREPYIRKLARKELIPWNATLEEVSIVVPSRFTSLRDELVEINWLNILLKTGAAMDRHLLSFTLDEITTIDNHFPECNVLTRWTVLRNGQQFSRFRGGSDAN